MDPALAAARARHQRLESLCAALGRALDDAGVGAALCGAARAVCDEGATAALAVVVDDGRALHVSSGDSALAGADGASTLSLSLENPLCEAARELVPRSVLDESGAVVLACYPLVTSGPVGEPRALAVLALGPSPPAPLDATRRDELSTLVKVAALALHRLRLAEEATAAREQAVRATRLRDLFLAAVSHELRAPLSALLLWEKILREEPDAVATRTRALCAIHDSAVSQSRMVDDLLDVARGMSGKLRIDRRRVAVAEVVRSAMEGASAPASARSVDLRLEAPGDLGVVMGDAIRLRQVLSNLLDNAIKFTPPGGTITLSAAYADGRARLAVRDSGRGFANGRAADLFEPFYQEREPGGAGGGGGDPAGLGVGLAIARHLVELHQGTIDAESAGPGAGASFTISLPAAPAERGEGASADPTAPLPARALRDVRILVVDDDQHVREALARIFARHGAQVEEADSAESGWRALCAGHHQILVCDIAMPGQDGYALIQRVRTAEDATVRAVPSLALTAHATIEDRDRAIDAGFDAHLAKPVEVARLVASVRQLLGPARSAEAPTNP